MASPLVRDIRGRGLFIGIELERGPILAADDAVEVLVQHGILTRDTHRNTVRFAPPLVITKAQVDQALTLEQNPISLNWIFAPSFCFVAQFIR